MENLHVYFEQDQFARQSGIQLQEVTAGRAKAALKIRPQHLNSHQAVHGGAIFTLADFAFAAASNSHGRLAVAINASISFMKAAREGTLLAEAREIALTPKLATYTVRVTDDAGDLVAIFQGMVYRKKEMILTPSQES